MVPVGRPRTIVLALLGRKKKSRCHVGWAHRAVRGADHANSRTPRQRYAQDPVMAKTLALERSAISDATVATEALAAWMRRERWVTVPATAEGTTSVATEYANQCIPVRAPSGTIRVTPKIPVSIHPTKLAMTHARRPLIRLNNSSVGRRPLARPGRR